MGLRLLLVLGVLLATPAASAQATLPPGFFHVEDVLVVAEGESLLVGPGTILTGPGRVEVWGNLTLAGATDQWAESHVPLLFLGNGSSRLERARLWNVNGTAATVKAGALTILDSRIEGNRAGLETTGGYVTGDGLVLRGHTTFALRTAANATVQLARATLTDNALALHASASSRVDLEDAVLERNGAHARFEDLEGGEVRLLRTDLGVTSLEGPGVRVQGNGTLRLDDVRFRGMAVALKVEGARVLGSRAVFEDNAVSIALSGGLVELDEPRLDTPAEVVGAHTGLVLLRNATYRSADASLSPPPVGLPARTTGFLVVALPVAVIVLAGAAYWAARSPGVAGRILPPPAAPPEVGGASPAPDPHPVPPLPGPLRPQEIRILKDIAAHPGTPQSAIAQRLGLTRQALHYHVKKLEARGLLRKVPNGRQTLCHVPPDIVPHLLGAQEDSVPPPGDSSTP